jgi:NADH-ubiquinone oxidoreductase chain 4
MIKIFFLLRLIFLIIYKFYEFQNLYFFISFIFIFFLPRIWYNLNISYFFLFDNLSFGLIFLRFWLIRLIVIARVKIKLENNNKNLFLFCINLLIFFLFFSFLVNNLFLFYFSFERTLIPTLFLILGWGYQPERIKAGMYLLFYTLLFSLPILFGIFYFQRKNIRIYFYELTIFNNISLNLLYFFFVYLF